MCASSTHMVALMIAPSDVGCQTKRHGSLAAGRRNFRLFRGWRYTGLLRQVVRLTARNREPGDDRLAHRNHTDGNDPGEQQLDP